MNTKNTLKKRVLSLLLALIMVLSMLPLSAFAAGETVYVAGTEQPAAETTEPEAPTEAPTEEPTEPAAAAQIAVYASDHEHNRGSDGNCTECDMPIIATVYRLGLAPAFCTTLAEAFAACGEEDEIFLEADAALTAEDSQTVTNHTSINLNEKTISGDGSITVDYTSELDDVGLYISGDGTLNVPITVNATGSMEVYGAVTFGAELNVNGKLLFQGDSAKLGKVTVSGADSALTVTGNSSIDELTIGEGAAIRLSGGRYGKFNASDSATAGDLLASGYVFAEPNSGTLIAPETMLTEFETHAYYPVTVVLCRHTALRDDGTCVFCGAPAEAKVGDMFFGTFGEAVAYANTMPGSTITLQSNVSIPGTTAVEDLPYIAANTTVDLNGKELDMVFVGKPEYDAEYEVTDITPGSLTVTGSGYVSNAITLYGGEVTVNSGEINTLKVRAYVPCTAAITGGEVQTLSTEEENDDAAVNVTVSGGTVKNVSSGAGTITFNGHTEAAAGETDPNWYVSSGKVILNDGTFNFTLRDCTGSLILNGGTFSKIELWLYGATTTLADLLGEGRAFYGEDGTIIKADELTALTNVTVKEHTHPDFSDDGKCPECGAPCRHTTVDETGKCTGCGAQFGVSLQVGSSISYHASFEAAIDAAPRNMSAPVTITLLTDSPAYDIWGSRNITLDLNGKHLLGDTVTVNDHCTLTLTGSFDEFSLPLIVNGDANGTGELDRTGILVINPTGGAGVVETINAKGASRVTVLGGTINNLYIQTTDTMELDYIDLAGGTYKNISFPNISGNITLTDLLAENCAFRCNEGFSKYPAGALIDYGFRLDAKTLIRDLSVVPCEHTRKNDTLGCCGYCGKLYAAKITTADGTVSYLETLTDEDALSAAGGTVKLLQDADTITVTLGCTIDLNSHKINSVMAAYPDQITVRGAGTIGSLTIGFKYYAGNATTLVLEETGGQPIEIQDLYIDKTTDATQLTCGTFGRISRRDGGLAAELLAEGYAFADADGSFVNGYVKQLESITVKKHTHVFTKNEEGLDECACGVACAHETIGADGKCNNCHYQLLVAALTFEDGTGAKFDNLKDAWDAAISFPGSTLKLLCDLSLDDSAEYFLAESGSFTFDLNGKTLEADAQGYIFQIAGTANVTIKNGSIYNTFYFAPGQTQFFYGNGNAVSVKGGTAVLENLELTGGEGGSDDNYVKPCPIQLESTGNLTVSGCTVHGTLLLWVFDSSATTVQIASTVMYGGLDYTGLGTEKDSELIRSFFAAGNKFLTDEGKFISINDDAYWTVVTQETVSFVQFTYSDSAKVVPHTHTYENGFCTSCEAPCDHSGDDHSHPATYFKQAVCSVCGASYGERIADTCAPTVTITGVLAMKRMDDAVTFDKYLNGSFTLHFEATDDSYSHEGFDPATDSVKLSFWQVEEAATLQEVSNAYDYGRFLPITGDAYTFAPAATSDGKTRIIYIAAEDAAGNRCFAVTEGFTYDLTAPVIEVLSPASETLEDGKTYSYCTSEITLKVTDDHFDAEGGLDVQFASETLMKDADGNYIIAYKDGRNVQTVTATDLAGNKVSVTIRLFSSHSFDESATCVHCGAKAAAKLTLGETTEMFATGDELFDALGKETYDGATVTLLQDISFTSNAAIRSDVTIELNGKTLGDVVFRGISIYSEVTIQSTGSKADIFAPIAVQKEAQLTMGAGIGTVRNLLPIGKLRIYSGSYNSLNSMRIPSVGEEAGAFQLYGGHYDSILLRGADIRDILAKGYRFEEMDYDAAIGKEASNVTVIACMHEGMTEGTPCPGCGLVPIASVRDGDTFFYYDRFEEAVRSAEAREDSVLTLWQDVELSEQTAGALLDGGFYHLAAGKYSIDLNGRTLTLNDGNSLAVEGDCDLNVTGGGSIHDGDAHTETIVVKSGAHLTVYSGDFGITLQAYGTDSLTLRGGSFRQIISEPDSTTRKSCSPLQYLANGFVFQLESGDYANESNVSTETVSNGTRYAIGDVAVVDSPMRITTQPGDVTIYDSTPADLRANVQAVASHANDNDEKVTVTLEKPDRTVVDTQELNAHPQMLIDFKLDGFTTADSGEYRIKLSWRGLAVYTDSFQITVLQCTHPEIYGNDNKCTQCKAEIVAQITKDSSITYYDDLTAALTVAQTDAYKDCELKLLTNVTETIKVSAGDFKLSVNGKTVEKLMVSKTAKLNVTNGTVNGTVTTAKTASLTASRITFKETVNCNGNGSFLYCTFETTLNARGDDVSVNFCTLNDVLNFSGGGTVNAGTVSGQINVNKDAVLDFAGSDGVYGAVLVKSGGTVYVNSGVKFTGDVTVESNAQLTIFAGEFLKLVANSDSTLTVRGKSTTVTTAEIAKNVNLTLGIGVTFGKITVVGKSLIDCLTSEQAFQDNGTGEVIDGRVGIASNVTVVAHTHDCKWKTNTHEKLCGCGYVAATDTAAPVISGVTNGGIYYGGIQFSVSDENEFTVTIDGSVVSSPLNTYLIEPDNEAHTITATDVAGNTASITISVMKLYPVVLSSGAGYTIHGESLAKHGEDYTFTVEIAEGYSKTSEFMVDVNGRPMHSDTNRYTYETVESALHITVFGVADITPPEAEITIGRNTFNAFMNTVTFGLFFKKTQTVTVTASDAGSGVASMEYLLSETAFESAGAITGIWTALDVENGAASFSMKPNQKTFIYIRVTDESGNVTVVNSEGIVLYTDAEKVTESAVFTMQSDADVVYTVKLNGNTVSAVYNGTQMLDSSACAVLANGMLMLRNSYLRTLAAGEYTLRIAFNPLGEQYAERDGNEAPAELTVKLIVGKKTPIIDHVPSDGKNYDGKPIGRPVFNTDSDGAATFAYKPADADDSAYTTAAPKDVGTYTIRITVAETDAFTAATSTMIFTIFPREVTISNVTVADKVYDATTDAIITSEGNVNGLVDGDNVTIVTGTAAFGDKNVGTAKTVTFTAFALSGADAANYELVAQPASVTADITAKEVAIEGVTVEPTKVYDGTNAAAITNYGTLSENLDGEDLVMIPGTAAYEDKHVGSGKAVSFVGFGLTGSAAANYTLSAQPAAVTADITAREITIIGASVEPAKAYDGTTVAAVTDTGVPSENFDGENLTVQAGTAAYGDKNVGTGKPVTFTDFALTGREAGNYKLIAQPVSVTADITAREVTIDGTTVAASKVYDGTTTAEITNVGTLSANFDGDDLTIQVGTAAYDNKNVGTGKRITFSGFMLTGKEAANYKLVAQPASTTADITAKELTIDGLKVSDKQYDGTNAAAIDGTPTLVGVVEGDNVRLVNGTPTFTSVAIDKDIPIQFTAFALDGDAETVSNYVLTQPTGITASIVEYLSVGTEYHVNSNDWINTDFVVTAADGWLLSLTNTANGEWTQQLTASNETSDGTLTFYVRNTTTGVISSVVTQHYKIDKTNPTGEVTLNERTAFQTVLNKISFGLFFNSEVHVKLTADDEASGTKSVLYYKSDTLLDDAAVRALTDWTEDSDFDIPAEDMEQFIIYVRIEDNAGNVTYIGSDGATFDTTAPEIISVENGTTYYVTKRVAVDDENLEAVTLNGEPVSEVFSLTGDTDAIYVIRATDKAGNETEITVVMKPISTVTDAIASITADNVKSSDAELIAAVERQILDIAEAFDEEESTAEEWQQLVDAAAKCKELEERIAAVAAEIDRISEAVSGYDISTVTSDDKAALEQLIADIDTLLNGDNLTEAEREALEALKAALEALLDRIAEAKAAAEAPEITEVSDITKDNVTPEDRGALEQAQTALEDALDEFGGNYTEEEREALEDLLETVKEALAALDNVENAAEEIGKLPNPEDARLDDKDEIDRVMEIFDSLTEHEKELLGEDARDKLNELAERIAELEEISFAPSIIEGAHQKWYERSNANARFVSNAEFDEFRTVLVDGAELSKTDYLAYEGSTVVELKASYLKTLSASEHTLSVVSKNGTASTTFTVVKEAKQNNPQTGDDSGLSLWIALLVLSGGAALAILCTTKKKKRMAR